MINRLRLWETRGVVKKKRVSWLDLGCGDGELVRLITAQGNEAIGVDEKMETEKAGLIQSSIEGLTLQKKFDIVSMYHVLEHVKKPEKVLKRVKKWLKHDGILVIEVPLVGNWTEKFLGNHYFAYYDKTHGYFFTKEEFLRLVEESGFRVIKKGKTFYEFPFTVITTSFKESLLKGIISLLLFLPLKLLSLFGLNDEIIRLYCVTQ